MVDRKRRDYESIKNGFISWRMSYRILAWKLDSLNEAITSYATLSDHQKGMISSDILRNSISSRQKKSLLHLSSKTKEGNNQVVSERKQVVSQPNKPRRQFLRQKKATGETFQPSLFSEHHQLAAPRVRQWGHHQLAAPRVRQWGHPQDITFTEKCSKRNQVHNMAFDSWQRIDVHIARNRKERGVALEAAKNNVHPKGLFQSEQTSPASSLKKGTKKEDSMNFINDMEERVDDWNPLLNTSICTPWNNPMDSAQPPLDHHAVPERCVSSTTSLRPPSEVASENKFNVESSLTIPRKSLNNYKKTTATIVLQNKANHRNWLTPCRENRVQSPPKSRSRTAPRHKRRQQAASDPYRPEFYNIDISVAPQNFESGATYRLFRVRIIDTSAPYAAPLVFTKCRENASHQIQFPVRKGQVKSGLNLARAFQHIGKNPFELYGHIVNIDVLCTSPTFLPMLNTTVHFNVEGNADCCLDNLNLVLRDEYSIETKDGRPIASEEDNSSFVEVTTTTTMSPAKNYHHIGEIMGAEDMDLNGVQAILHHDQLDDYKGMNREEKIEEMKRLRERLLGKLNATEEKIIHPTQKGYTRQTSSPSVRSPVHSSPVVRSPSEQVTPVEYIRVPAMWYQ